MKTTLPLTMTIASAVLIMVCVFFGVMPKVGEEVDKWFVLSTAVVCCIGLVNLTTVHQRNVTRRGKDWDLSVIMLLITYGYLALGLVVGPTNKTYSWIFESTQVPLGATFYSLLAFYIVSAAYRAFRAKTRDAAVLLGAAIIVLLGRAPLGEAIFPWFGEATRWLMDIPTTAAMRAVTFGATLGAIITGIRLFFGLERPYSAAGE